MSQTKIKVNKEKEAKLLRPVQVQLQRLKIGKIWITIEGDSSLICHRWGTKAVQQMLDKHMQKAKAPRAAKDPEQDFKDSLYPYPGGGYGFPTNGLKSSAVNAADKDMGIPKTKARAAFHIDGDMVEIIGEPTKRQDMVRVGQNQPDIRFRGEFKEWLMKFLVHYNTGILSAEQVVNLFNLAGFGVGLGEWRPEKNGSYGRFHVVTD
jgi:hypothetical protein